MVYLRRLQCLKNSFVKLMWLKKCKLAHWSMNEIINTKIFELINNIRRKIRFLRTYFFQLACFFRNWLRRKAAARGNSTCCSQKFVQPRPWPHTRIPLSWQKVEPLVSNTLDGMAAAATNNKGLIQCINQSSLSEELNPLQLLDMFKKVSKHTTNPFAIQLSQSIFSSILHCWEWRRPIPTQKIWLWHVFLSRQFVSVHRWYLKWRPKRESPRIRDFLSEKNPILSPFQYGRWLDDETKQNSANQRCDCQAYRVKWKDWADSGRLRFLSIALCTIFWVIWGAIEHDGESKNDDHIESFALTRPFLSAKTSYSRYCATLERQTRPFPWKFVWQTCGFFRTYRNLARSEFDDPSSGNARLSGQNPNLSRTGHNSQHQFDASADPQRHRCANYVQQKGSAFKNYLACGNRDKVAQYLKVINCF
jgi:hypothetical protein